MGGLEKFCNYAKSRLGNNYDLVIAFAGITPGVGKSTLAIQTGMLIDPNFSLEKNIAYIPNFDAINKQFFSFQKGSYFLIDEAIKVLYKLRWMDRLQISLSEMYDLNRKNNVCTALCIPRFIDLSEHFRQYRVKFWIQVIARGRAVVYTRDEDEHTSDPWHFKENYEMKREWWYKRGKRVADIGVDERIDIARKTIGYLTDFNFDPMEPKIEKEYLELLEKNKKEYESKKDEEKETNSLGTIEKRRILQYENLILALTKEGRSPKDISALMKCNLYNIYRILKKHGENPRKVDGGENIEPIME